MAQNKFIAGVGRVLLFDGDALIGVAKTLTESTFEFSITSEDIRGGAGNALWGKYFHDSNLAVNMTDAMFKFEYIAANLGVNIEQGGLSMYESSASGETIGSGGKITLTHTPVAFNGSYIGWYKKPTDNNWSIATIAGNTMTIPNAAQGDVYCVKYMYQSADARMITIKSQYVPKVLHIVILNDLFSGDVADVGTATRCGRIITDIPSFQLDGNQSLNLTATSAASVGLTGNALAIEAGLSCEEDPYYGTMTEEIYGATWQENVIALAVENADMELSASAQEALIVRAVYGGGMASSRQSNDAFTFAVESGNSATVNDEGVVTASGSATGDTIISVTLTDYDITAYATVSVG